MTTQIVTWNADIAPLGEAVVAVGVFDGVHLGHQALLADTVADAIARGVRSVAVTFDRDPDQVVSPSTAAPQLLTLHDKLAEMSCTGIDVILVIPFTEQVASMAPESFLEDLLLRTVTPASVHVGNDFRFGRMATGDVSTLRQFGLRYDFEVAPHELVSVGGAAVTSTRIRALIGEGDITQATELLGKHPRVSGIVHRGRAEGAQLGFPTANVVPVHFAALPAPGVYSGRALVPDGSTWAAAISVGKPPMFPQATDVLEAHLIQFEGDLYDQPVTLEIWERLRDQRSFPSLEDLAAAIGEDVENALESAGFTEEELAEQPEMPATDETEFDSEEWLLVASRRFSTPAAGAEGFSLVAPLVAANIPFRWDPYAPQDSPTGLHVPATRDFDVLVPESMYDAALEVLADAGGPTDLPLYSDDDSDPVTDPAALEAAEQAVRGVKVDMGFETLLNFGTAQAEEEDPGWCVLAKGLTPDRETLLVLDSMLFDAGVPAAWDPFRPDERPRWGSSADAPLILSVPADQLDLARAIYRTWSSTTAPAEQTS